MHQFINYLIIKTVLDSFLKDTSQNFKSTNASSFYLRGFEGKDKLGK